MPKSVILIHIGEGDLMRIFSATISREYGGTLDGVSPEASRHDDKSFGDA